MTNTTAPTAPAMIKNILAVFEQVDLADLSASVDWYADARAFCEALAAECGYSMEQVAGVVSATSPRKEWGQNKALAARIVRAGGGIREGYFKAALIKCDAILAGADIEATLNGEKTVNFYRSITSGGVEGMTIDRHALDVAYGVKHSDDTRPRIAGALYEAVSAAYIEAATQLQGEGLIVSPAELQAITWVAWKN